MKEVVDDLSRRIKERGVRVRERQELLRDLLGPAPGKVLADRLRAACGKVEEAGRRLAGGNQ